METTPDLVRIRTERNARVYHLGDPAGAAEIWFVLHGFGHLAGSFIATFAPAARPGRLIVAPEALNHYYLDHRAKKVGATWMTSEDRGAEIADYVGYLDRVGDEYLARAPGARIEIHGFSQGAATAARWLALGRVHAARLVLWGGEIPPDPTVESYRDRLNAADLTVVIGDSDQFITPSRVEREAERLDAAGVSYTLHRFAGGHVVPEDVLARLG
jgi:predicted esterase